MFELETQNRIIANDLELSETLVYELTSAATLNQEQRARYLQYQSATAVDVDAQETLWEEVKGYQYVLSQNFIQTEEPIQITKRISAIQIDGGYRLPEGTKYDYALHPHFMIINGDSIYVASNTIYADGSVESGLYRLDNNEETLTLLNTLVCMDLLQGSEEDFDKGFNKFLLALTTYDEKLDLAAYGLIKAYFESRGIESLLEGDEFTELFRVRTDSAQGIDVKRLCAKLMRTTGKRVKSEFTGLGTIVNYDGYYLGLAMKDVDEQTIVGIKQF